MATMLGMSTKIQTPEDLATSMPHNTYACGPVGHALRVIEARDEQIRAWCLEQAGAFKAAETEHEAAASECYRKQDDSGAREHEILSAKNEARADVLRELAEALGGKP